ncbi:MAG: tRNA (adenosine(37)-N6)-threonylcarbamoyltransferase complex dimerization subunit type 1 TsaB [Leptospiraceae bacterium]|nr:tRNA (adenosine(37)-N6)-threonylcarbamoyltransferase complex dimerization subunit type 1 TsaB [Leptospiraceae bacterium]
MGEKTILSIDTSTDWVFAGIYSFDDTKIIDRIEFKEQLKRESSQKLVLILQDLLKKTDLKKPNIVSGTIGPGSFTGIRLSTAVIRNLSQIWEIPALAINTLELYSFYYYKKNEKRTLVAIDGKMNKFFVGGYSIDGFTGEFDISLEEMKDKFTDYEVYSNQRIENFKFMDDDFPTHSSFLEHKIDKLNSIDTRFTNYSEITPLYMRETYADRKK